ncbi:hypothetical protein BS47DRAFT_1112620 [Hydnum rufescens UP504]|uniref:Glycosyltransferase family 69 protein n=1 Tax=Hydnum rufescens UP504 TaxID=1448309 RepID=A0A9P6AUD5_9AGAM|nr:hypothetical protein BS47DRAFT_1112620 [Hydnum rufescens UP504]
MGISFAFRRRSLIRLAALVAFILIIRYLLLPPPATTEIAHHNYIERVTRAADKSLDVQRYPFLQSRIGREEELDILTKFVEDGTNSFWTNFQLPFLLAPETQHVDAQAVRNSIEDLLSLNGWVAAACPTLSRPFGQNRREDSYDGIVGENRLYYIAIIIHSADHFLVDQLATIVQLARRLGTRNIFVSMLDYDSNDSTQTLTDLAEAVMTLLSIPFRIRRVDPMYEEEAASYYPLEEAYTRNLALEPLHELNVRRGIKFEKVIWLKGFTCPNDILENLQVSKANHAAMTCGMDWAESNGFFIFSDRWRTRDMDGDQFRVSRSSSPSAPPREEIAAKRYAAHLPFQVFCCESGTHIVDPAQTYYRGLAYRNSARFHNSTSSNPPPTWDPYGECMDSSQASFCRDIWVEAARNGARPVDQPAKPERLGATSSAGRVKRQVQAQDKAVPPDQAEDQAESPDQAEDKAVPPDQAEDKAVPPDQAEDKAVPPDQAEDKAVPPDQAQDNGVRPKIKEESDANAGSDYDAMPGSSPPPLEDSHTSFAVPNLHFEPARIIINPRCVTTYAGVSHTRLANDLFGPDEDDLVGGYDAHKYVLEEWAAAPDSYVCQEQRYTGGRKSPKNQRSSPFSIQSELEALL